MVSIILNTVLFAMLIIEIIYTQPSQDTKKPNIDIRTLQKEIYKIGQLKDLTKLGINLPPVVPQTQKITGRKSGSTFSNMETKDNSLKDAIPGHCDPKPVCISNPLVSSITANNQLVFPPCINIHRCGPREGCCPQNEKCVPIKSEMVKFKSVGIINIALTSPVFEDSTVNVQNDTECSCKCQWETDDDCKQLNPNYVKDTGSCACICPNILYCDAFHEFDKEQCKCVCNKSKYTKLEQICKTRVMKWNETSCKCESPKTVLKFDSTKS